MWARRANRARKRGGSRAGETKPLINQLVSQRYETLEKIGEGPLFTVYKARDKAQNRIVALKAVAGAFARDRALLEGLERGLEASANLTIPTSRTFMSGARMGTRSMPLWNSCAASICANASDASRHLRFPLP